MTTTEDVRSRNLRALIDRASLSEVSKRSERSKAQLCSMANGKRAFGERVARAIEESMGLPVGWFDQERGGATDEAEDQLTGVEVEYLPGEAENLFPVSTIVLQGGEKTMRGVQIYLDSSVFKQNFPGEQISNFCAAIVLDTSMSPDLNPNDRVLIDVAKPEFSTEGVYCLNTPGGKILRRVSCNLDGTHVISSNKKEDKQILENFENVSIIGRVQLVWNARKI